MADFQKSIALTNPAAIPGDRANQQPTIYAPINFIAGAGVKVGGFVWRDAADAGKVVAAGEGEPLGFMERVQNFLMYDLSKGGTLDIPENSEVNVAIRGDFFALADETVAIGATVYANTTTGAVTFNSSGAVDTGWKAFTAGEEGDVVIITRR